jgi:hypothetical protein
MSTTIKFNSGGFMTRHFTRGQFRFTFDSQQYTWTRSEILEVVNLLLSTPTTDITPVDRCPQCNGPIDTEQSVTMVLGEGGPKIIACHGCTVVNAKRTKVGVMHPVDTVNERPKLAPNQFIPTDTTIIPHRRINNDKYAIDATGCNWGCDFCGAAPGEPCK